MLFLHKKEDLCVAKHASEEKLMKLITFEVNGKTQTIDEHDDEVVNNMTADHILLFYEMSFVTKP